MWTRNNNVLNWNMLKHFIYSSFSKLTTSSLCSLYYKYSLKLFSFFCILSFLVKTIFIDQTFYSATHYLAAVWLDSRHDLNSFYYWVSFIEENFKLSKSRLLLQLLSWEFKFSWRACVNKREHRDHDYIMHEATVKI